MALILVALMITTGMTFSKTAIDSVDTITTNWKQSVELGEKLSGTDINIIDARTSTEALYVYVRNVGRVQLANFSKWDIFAHYYEENGTYYIRRLSYVESGAPGMNQWTINEIYTTPTLTQNELFQPGILDPCEVAEFRLNLSPVPGIDSTGWIILSTDNGITASTQFESEEY